MPSRIGKPDCSDDQTRPQDDTRCGVTYSWRNLAQEKVSLLLVNSGPSSLLDGLDVDSSLQRASGFFPEHPILEHVECFHFMLSVVVGGSICCFCWKPLCFIHRLYLLYLMFVCCSCPPHMVLASLVILGALDVACLLETQEIRGIKVLASPVLHHFLGWV